MYRTISTILAACALSSPATLADEPSDVAFNTFGQWQTACDAWGVAAICRSHWRPGLHGRHIVQDYTIRSAADDALIFAGRGLYQLSGATVEGVWEDSRGQILTLGGSYSNGVLNVVWGDATVEIGRSIYQFKDGQLSVRDAVLTDNGWREFMAVDYPLRIDE